MRHWGIRARVLFLALVPSILILLTLVSYFTYARIAEVDTALTRHGVALARQLVPAAEFALFAGDHAALQHLAELAANEADVTEIAISDASGQVVARSSRGTGPVEDVLRFTQPVTQTRLAAPEASVQTSSASVAMGVISVAMSRAAAHAEQRRLLFVGVALGLGCVVLAIVLAVFIGNSVVHPIQDLARAMETLGRGQPISPLPLTGGGEFRTLADGFNEMAKRLLADAGELQHKIDVATQALLAQKDAAVQATTEKSRFLAAASHDLRQPLHAIGLFTATLERRARGLELEPVVRDLVLAVGVMERLFDALLDISKLDSGTISVESKAFPIGRVFNQLAAEQADAVREKGLRLVMKPGDYAVVSDELLLHRLLSNLLGNAIRYSHSGTVLCACRPRGADVRIEVRDSGIGIAPERQSEIFQEFYQIDNPARDRRRGLGLGLAIVARIARLLGTQVEVRSAPGRGSVFSLRLPRAPAISSAVVEDGGRRSEPGQTDSVVSVLVVDDDPLVIAGNRALLEDMGCPAIAVSDGAAAREALRMLEGRPVLVLCDLWLSGKESGIDVLQQLAALTTSPFSGIVISGDTRPETIQAVKAAGFPLLHKPVAAAKLRALVMQFEWRVRYEGRPDDEHEDPSR